MGNQITQELWLDCTQSSNQVVSNKTLWWEEIGPYNRQWICLANAWYTCQKFKKHEPTSSKKHGSLWKEFVNREFFCLSSTAWIAGMPLPVTMPVNALRDFQSSQHGQVGSFAVVWSNKSLTCHNLHYVDSLFSGPNTVNKLGDPPRIAQFMFTQTQTIHYWLTTHSQFLSFRKSFKQTITKTPNCSEAQPTAIGSKQQTEMDHMHQTPADRRHCEILERNEWTWATSITLGQDDDDFNEPHMNHFFLVPLW